ncbi:MAG TPA: hypothetical protein DEA05_14620 [Rhodobacteraceae bacterium]|jgi:hypothetical protein|nr:hypothetical protein [Paracoccaceae bacterium]
MPRRIVIHAGFHKTGTSSVQQTLRTNRAALKPYLRSVLKWGMRDLLHASRGYSTWRDPLSLGKVRRRFTAMMKAQGDMPRRTLCLSAEELAGHMPGREGVDDYGAAPVLAAEMARGAAEVHPGAETLFVFSTRAPETWLRSAYWEHVKSSSLTEDYEDFAARMAGAADLDRIVDLVSATQPCRVHRAAIEDHAAAPAAPLLRLCGVPETVIDALPPVPLANARPGSDVLEALLEANRRYRDRDERKAAKQAILAREAGEPT